MSWTSASRSELVPIVCIEPQKTLLPLVQLQLQLFTVLYLHHSSRTFVCLSYISEWAAKHFQHLKRHVSEFSLLWNTSQPLRISSSISSRITNADGSVMGCCYGDKWTRSRFLSRQKNEQLSLTEPQDILFTNRLPEPMSLRLLQRCFLFGQSFESWARAQTIIHRALCSRWKQTDGLQFGHFAGTERRQVRLTVAAVCVFVCKCSSHATRLQSPSSWSWTKSYFLSSVVHCLIVLRTLSGRSLRSWRAGMSWSNNTGANRHKEPGTQAPPVVWDPCFFVHSWPKHQLVSCSLYIHPHITQQPRLSFHFHRIITIPTLPCQAARFLNPKRHPPTLKPNLS